MTSSDDGVDELVTGGVDDFSGAAASFVTVDDGGGGVGSLATAGAGSGAGGLTSFGFSTWGSSGRAVLV